MSDQPWLAFLDDEDRAQFFTEMREALDGAEKSGDAAVVEGCLCAWKVTAEALSDPVVRAALTSPLDEADFTEVPRP